MVNAVFIGTAIRLVPPECCSMAAWAHLAAGANDVGECDVTVIEDGIVVRRQPMWADCLGQPPETELAIVGHGLHPVEPAHRTSVRAKGYTFYQNELIEHWYGARWAW